MKSLGQLRCKFVTKREAKTVRYFTVVLTLAVCTACQNASSETRPAIEATTLIKDFKQATAEMRRRYDGKEIVVRGYVLFQASLPGDVTEQGSITLRDSDHTTPLTCWFSREQVREFAKIRGDQFVVVKGVFTGETGAELKFCKLIKVE